MCEQRNEERHENDDNLGPFQRPAQDEDNSALWVSGVTHATKIKNPACLVCHDTPDRAPTSMLTIYGDKGDFG